MLPKIPIGHWVDLLIQWSIDNLKPLFDFVVVIVNYMMDGLSFILMAPPPWIFIIISIPLVWFIAGRNTAIGTALGFLLIYDLNIWGPSMQTLAMIISATIVALVVGIPLGIWTARNDSVHKVVMPALDFMQTMPPFVYLIPAVFFFGIGQVPGLISTVVFAMPPAIRLTGLGIRQVPEELVEAAEAFGATKTQKLIKVQLPVAMPTIMAGVNQCIMLALSMVVIAAMIGAGGLGSEVLRGLQRLNVPVGFEGGLAIVVLAIILDRITQNFTNKRKIKGGD
ncbi:glycine betaine/proline transport system permease protein [Desulfotomaculum arcticum]|uniref:Glycine betaine/proline transport system permease protein n=1 Tax=Desulfotruncus arcticus DSM 17038 TaxID=1121424 RepID=A0A1I2RB50_9FIRM|nr:proline/glycine betaine ABC transporter permease [Desulfotruncus arcticus]SFG37273.1 glycine betaine/proline transport system permease protein [Desulfotomaculum arcticum] [Desulfotruncus arcticus DSM 17038]